MEQKLSIKAIEKVLKETSDLSSELNKFRNDTRAGVIKLIKKYDKELQKQKEEKEAFDLRMYFDTMFKIDSNLVGIDEVGRGPLAGPVVAAAVILPQNVQLVGIRDSKKLTHEKREELFEEIKSKALAIGIGVVDNNVIDDINILQATFRAMREALDKIEVPYDKILVDGNKTIPDVNVNQTAVISGDDKSASIAAASIIAKVTRDRMMEEYDKQYPGYDWASNKGYGSKKHYEGLKQLGLTKLHRKSFIRDSDLSYD